MQPTRVTGVAGGDRPLADPRLADGMMDSYPLPAGYRNVADLVCHDDGARLIVVAGSGRAR
jgi:hypothetical protein